jgi:gliding motility-associated-like protein
VLQSGGAVNWNVGQLTVHPVSTQQYIVTASRPPCPDAKDTVTITVGDSLYINPSVLPVYKLNNDYSQQLVSNAESPVFTLIGGSLPSGLFLDSHGEITGKCQDENTSASAFTVQIEDIHDCKTVKEYTFAKKLFVPAAFTPNGDGINDVFMQGYKVVIFDRLGVEIFRGDDGLNGAYKGKPARQDIYFYQLYYEKDNVQTGYIGLEL